MEDQAIVDLYWAREEQALEESDRKYGGLCRSVAYHILSSREDSEECVNDTWLRAWHAMPPHRPGVLSAFFSRITRNLSLDRYKASRADKRGGGQMTLALEELDQCVPGKQSVEDAIAMDELTEILDRFLRTLPERDCCIFLRRYWYVDSVHDIAKAYQMPEGSVKSTLHRLRQKLKVVLEQEGVRL